MKLFIATVIFLTLYACSLQATTHTITNSGFTFSPSSLTIELGDTVLFSIGGTHTVVEVSQTTWNANGNTQLPGGFSRGSGGGTVVITTTGVHYYVCGVHNLSGMKGTITVNPVTDVQPVSDRTPARFSLAQNYPNPFNPSTAIGFSITRTSFTEIAVYDGIGRRVKTLVSETLPAGEFSAVWDGSDDKGSPAGSGPYFIRMSARNDEKDYFAVRKILLVR